MVRILFSRVTSRSELFPPRIFLFISLFPKPNVRMHCTTKRRYFAPLSRPLESPKCVRSVKATVCVDGTAKARRSRASSWPSRWSRRPAAAHEARRRCVCSTVPLGWATRSRGTGGSRSMANRKVPRVSIHFHLKMITRYPPGPLRFGPLTGYLPFLGGKRVGST